MHVYKTEMYRPPVFSILTLLHSERPKLHNINPIALRMAKTPYGVLAVLSAIGLKQCSDNLSSSNDPLFKISCAKNGPNFISRLRNAKAFIKDRHVVFEVIT